jgi:uroporphyrinogen decarboxylase
MTHRERVACALDHRQPDRPPLQVSFTPEFADRLASELGMTDENHNPHGGGNNYALEIATGQDMLLTSVGWANCYYNSEEAYTDEWGIGWRSAPYETPFGTGRYTEVSHHPLADDDAVSSYKAPDPGRSELYREAEELIARYGGEYWITGVTVTTIFETAWALRGLEQMMMDFILDPDLAEAILDIPYRYHLAAAERLVKAGVDMIWIGDDVGSQHSMMFSPDQWRRFLKPKMAHFISSLKAINPAVKLAYHSDGMIMPIIPELIDIGLDVLNPVQPQSMDPSELKRMFGDRLSFWGTIDEQHTLPYGTPTDVIAETRDRMDIVGKGGGLILGPTHHVQLDTPMENFRAMVDTVTGGR